MVHCYLQMGVGGRVSVLWTPSRIKRMGMYFDPGIKEYGCFETSKCFIYTEEGGDAK